MALGHSEQQVHLHLPVEEAFEACRAAGAACGKVLESHPNTGTLIVRTSYGLQRVKLRVSVLPGEGGSVVTIGSASDDVWGAGGRKGTDKLLSALDARRTTASVPEEHGGQVDPPGDAITDPKARLTRLEQLRSDGLLTDDEYAEKRQQILDDL